MERPRTFQEYVRWLVTPRPEGRGLTQVEVARLAGARAPTTARDWLLGARPGMHYLRRLAESLGEDYGYLCRLAGYDVGPTLLNGRVSGTADAIDEEMEIEQLQAVAVARIRDLAEQMIAEVGALTTRRRSGGRRQAPSQSARG